MVMYILVLSVFMWFIEYAYTMQTLLGGVLCTATVY